MTLAYGTAKDRKKALKSMKVRMHMQREAGKGNQLTT